MENVCTWPSRKLASGVPVLATPGTSLPIALNVNDPVGDGGWMTFSRSQRKSSPIFNVCRPFSHVNESAASDTLGLKFDAVLGGEPSRWEPRTRNVGSVLGNLAVEGMPGMLRTPPADAASWAAVRPTVR